MTQDGQPDPLVGQVVASKYRVVRLLGEGGMGCVYLAEQQLGSTARKVALKTLHKHLSHDESIQKRFDREAGTVAGLEHPNTIQVFDYGKMEDGTLYIVMEFVEGQSVADILEKEGAMPPARVENIFRQVCGSLEEAHSKGIIHRDLKPDNVVLCNRAGQKDWVEVLDFGIAKRSSEHDPNEAKLTQQGMVLGTPPYMSPEQFTGMPVDVRSDIYALGVMAYEMLSGKLPWEANTAWEWASKHMTEPPRPIETQPLGPNVPERMRHAIARALAKNKEERFNSAHEFFEALSSNGAAVSAPVASAPMARAKTEMAQPAMMGPAGSAMTPPAGVPAYGPPSNPQPMGPGPGVSVPHAPPGHHGPAKKGGSGLIIGLGAVAVLLLAGAGIAVVASRKGPKPVDTSSVADLNKSATVTSAASSAPPATNDSAAVASSEPLGATTPLEPGTPKPTTPVTPTQPGTKPGPKPGTPASIPTPTPPPKADPPACVTYRNARAAGKKAGILAGLEQQCRAAGGTP